MDNKNYFNSFHGKNCFKSDLDQHDGKLKEFDQMIWSFQKEISELDLTKHIDKSAPLFEQIHALVEACEFFNNHNDVFIVQLKENLLSIANIDWEIHHGPEKQELMEMYITGEKDVDVEFGLELEHLLQRMTQNYQKYILHQLVQDDFVSKA
jgi:hypothetical protein